VTGPVGGGPQGAPPQPLSAELEWQGESRFLARSSGVELLLESPAVHGPSPVQALVCALAGCMASDVALVIQRSRLAMKALRARVTAERAPTDPRRLLRVDLHFVIEGAIAKDRVEHALALSREKYCSVWHSLRTDIELHTSFEVTAPDSAPAAPR
jgi:putative redox protein